MGTGRRRRGEALPGRRRIRRPRNSQVARTPGCPASPPLSRYGGAAGETGLVVVPVARPEPLLGSAAVLAGALGLAAPVALQSGDNNAHRVHQRVRGIGRGSR